MSEDSRPQIRPWMVIVGLLAAVLAFLQFRASDQANRDWNACLAGDTSKCEQVL